MLSFPPFWPWLTRLGEAQFFAPPGFAGPVLGLAQRGRARCAAGLGGAQPAALGRRHRRDDCQQAGLHGLGWGWARFDFTGFSGHAMFAAAVLPLLAGLALAAHGPAREPGRPWAGRARAGIALAYLLAALIAYSRLKVGAHSASELVTGFLLGAAASGLSLWLAPPLRRPLPRSLPLAALAVLLLLPVAAPLSRSHDWVIHWALQLSGRSQPFERLELQREPS